MHLRSAYYALYPGHNAANYAFRAVSLCQEALFALVPSPGRIRIAIGAAWSLRTVRGMLGCFG